MYTLEILKLNEPEPIEVYHDTAREMLDNIEQLLSFKEDNPLKSINLFFDHIKICSLGSDFTLGDVVSAVNTFHTERFKENTYFKNVLGFLHRFNLVLQKEDVLKVKISLFKKIASQPYFSLSDEESLILNRFTYFSKIKNNNGVYSLTQKEIYDLLFLILTDLMQSALTDINHEVEMFLFPIPPEELKIKYEDHVNANISEP